MQAPPHWGPLSILKCASICLCFLVSAERRSNPPFYNQKTKSLIVRQFQLCTDISAAGSRHSSQKKNTLTSTSRSPKWKHCQIFWLPPRGLVHWLIVSMVSTLSYPQLWPWWLRLWDPVYHPWSPVTWGARSCDNFDTKGSYTQMSLYILLQLLAQEVRLSERGPSPSGFYHVYGNMLNV